jgi:formylglycine-generating enzyme required for sulfatase activity
MSACEIGIRFRKCDFCVTQRDSYARFSPSNTKMDTCGRPLYGHNGGVWEWTSTLLKGYKGFEQSEVYPGYSVDFYDELHHVVVSLQMSWSRVVSNLVHRLARRIVRHHPARSQS